MSDYKYSIQAKNVSKIFYKNSKEIKALVDIDVSIKRGSIHGLLGPNGAGKSTFINILGGLVKKNTGQISICGIDIDKNSKLSKFKIGIVPQELNIDPFFSPAELLELQAGLYGIPKNKRKTDEILDNLKLTDQRNAYARTLSGGMRRRLLIAKALVHSPEMLILDEPTAGVDIDIRKSVWEYIKKINSNGTTICLTTHYLEEAENLCDQITIINHGRILKDDSKENLLNIISKKKVKFICESISEIPNQLQTYKPKIIENNLFITYDKQRTKLADIISILNDQGIKFTELETFESDLEDVFLKIIKS